MKLFFLSLHGLPLAILSTSCLASGSGSFRSGGTASGGGAQGDPNGPVASSYGGPADPSSSSGAPVGPAAGPAEPRWDDFAFAVRERSGSYNAPWVITKLTTFKVGKTCYAKLGSKDSDSLNNTAYYTRSVLALAKAWTGNDWDQIENQHTDRAKDRSLVEPMMDEFAKRFHMTIAIEGDDCEVDRRGLWIRDWYSIGEAFEKYPPAAG